MAESLSIDAQPLPFEGFLAHLRRLGFVIGVDQHLRMEQLIERIGGHCAPGDLKTLLCPIFAVSEKQQELFYDAFDSNFPLFVVSNAEAAGASEDVTLAALPRRVVPSRRWLYFAAATVLAAGLIAVAIWRPWTPVAPPLAAEAPVQPPVQAPATPPAPEPVRAEPVQTERRPIPPREPSLLERASPWLAILIPVLWFACYELYRFRRRKLVLQKQHGKMPPHSWPIRLKASAARIYESPAFYTAARRLHSRVRGDSPDLDLAGTISATIRAFGYSRFQYRRMTRLPDYLVLIDRASSHDHQARLFDRLAGALHEEGLFLERYFYEGDPRECWREDSERAVSLAELQRRYSGHRLLLLGDAGRLVDAVSGKLTRWSGLLEGWTDRAILTPVPPSQWGVAERALAGRFIVLPATQNGLLALVDYFGGSGPADTRGWFDELPSPRDLDSPAMLREHLGPQAFLWLCACAVYPELHWDLTLHLGSLPSMPEGLINEADLLRLIRLPWFRAGSIPDELRWSLIQELSPEQEREVREAIIDLIEKSPAPEETFAADTQRVQILFQRYFLVCRDAARRGIRRVLEHIPEGEIQREYVVLRSLESLRGSAVDFLLPARLRRLLFAQGTSVLGLRTGVRLVLTLFVLGVGFSAVSYWKVFRLESEINSLAKNSTMDESERRERIDQLEDLLARAPIDLRFGIDLRSPWSRLSERSVVVSEKQVQFDKSSVDSSKAELEVRQRLAREVGKAQVESAKDADELARLRLGSAPAGQLIPSLETLLGRSTAELEAKQAEELARLRLGSAPARQFIPSPSAPAPAGILFITANVDGAQVSVSGQLSRDHVQQGLWKQSLPPGEYSVRLTLDGYDAVEEKIMIAAGKETTRRFELKPSPTMAILRILGGTPEAEVWLDGQQIGKLNAGSLGPASIAPGAHSIRFVKENYESSAELKVQAAVRQTVLISGSEAQLKPFGLLWITDVQPYDAQLTIQRRGEAPHQLAVRAVSLQQGTYILRGVADQYEPVEQEVQVSPGRGTNVKVVLKPKAPVTETDSEAAKAEMRKTIAGLKSTRGDLGVQSGPIATNGKELAALRDLGERNYTEFKIAVGKGKNKQPHRVGDVSVLLKSTDPKKFKYTIELTIDDKTVEKKDRNINEPVQFMLSRARQPYELVVNDIEKDFIAGYLSAPRVTPGYLTIDEVVRLTRAKVSDDVIVERVKRNAKPFDLNADEIRVLKEAGVSEPVIDYMINPNYSPSRLPPPTVDPRTIILHATVADKSGKFLTNLPQSAFKVSENGVEQPLKTFSRGDAPVSMGLIIDNSASMRDKRAKVAAALLGMVKVMEAKLRAASKPEDEVFVVNFDDEPYLDQPFTNDTKKLEQALDRLDSRGGTVVRDAISLSIDYAKEKGTREKKVVVVVTDGNDNTSNITLEQLIRKARQSEVLIYFIGLPYDVESPAASVSSILARRDLRQLAQNSGGLDYYPKDLAELDRVAMQIGNEIGYQYVLGYLPTNTALDGSFRTIKVTISGYGNPTVRTRNGYYANPGTGGPPR